MRLSKAFAQTSALIGALLLPLSIQAAEWSEKLGYYEVNQAYLNLSHCENRGKPTHYASKYLHFTTAADTIESQYKVSTCDGENIADLSCGGGYKSTVLDTVSSEGIEGYYFNAHQQTAKNGESQCLLTALRRRVIPLKGNYIQYQRTDWGSLLSDYRHECTQETAKLFYEAQSLKCSSHIDIDASLVKVVN